jgi:ankyrin repeat protein
MRDRPTEAKLLIAAGAKPEIARDADGDPALVTAAFRENIAVLRALLQVPHPLATKSLALLEAAGVGNLTIVKLLVKHGADPAWTSPLGNSALSIARKRKRSDIVAYLRGLASC